MRHESWFEREIADLQINIPQVSQQDEQELKSQVSQIPLVKVPADSFKGGYQRFRIRKDFQESYYRVYRTVKALGGILTSSGSLRDLTATASQGRSSTSLHYLGRAIDLYLYSGMQSINDPYVIHNDGGNDKHPLWKVYCRSMNPIPTDNLYNSALIKEIELEVCLWKKDIGYERKKVYGRFFDLSDIFLSQGWKRIPARQAWKSNYASVEWWHFQNESWLIEDQTTFGDELKKIWKLADVQKSSLPLNAIWRKGAFRK
ncbi:MAG: hypothetical protein HY960_06495 [Ignavibacteriae bacterium]|nr:hypothetical protein [Ignavibacteriota bacterium]